MNTRMRRLALLSVGILVGALTACVAGVGYDDEVAVAYSPGYIQPYGYEYGGWGPGYLVGPGRGGYRRAPPSAHTYRSAPQSRPMPSMPHGPRGGGGGGRGGGGRGGHR